MRLQRVVHVAILSALGSIAVVGIGSAQTTDATSAPVALPSLAPTTPPTGAGSSASASASMAFPSDPATRAAMLRTLQSVLAEQRRVVDETRAATLASLTPAHRSFVASIVGQLATAPSPDPIAAARQIDASLSLPERLGVLRADADRRARERELMTRTTAELTAQMTPEQRAAVQRRVVEVQSDAMRLTPSQRAAMSRDARAFLGILAPGTVAIGTPQSAGELVLQAVTAHANVLGF